MDYNLQTLLVYLIPPHIDENNVRINVVIHRAMVITIPNIKNDACSATHALIVMLILIMRQITIKSYYLFYE